MGTKPLMTLADIEISGIGQYIHVLSFDLTTEVNQHGVLHCTVMLDGDHAEDKSYKGSIIKVTLRDGSILFQGVCTTSGISKVSGYMELSITAHTFSYEADKVANSRTFQDSSKTLSQIMQSVLGEYQAHILYQTDITIPEMLVQDHETNWKFVIRIANQYGCNVFVQASASKLCVAFDQIDFGNVDLGKNVTVRKQSKNMNEMRLQQGNGNTDVATYQFEKTTLESNNLTASAGYSSNGEMVLASRISSAKGVITNQIECQNRNDVTASYQSKDGSSWTTRILSGKVLSVNGTKIKVQYDSDQSQDDAAALEIDYSHAMNNEFYCMPDINDKVFVYCDNRGNAYALGSKRTNTEDPFFQQPSEKAITVMDQMIKFAADSLDITATRKDHDENKDTKISISLNQNSGIDINAVGGIYILSDQSVYLGATQKTIAEIDQALKYTEQKFDASYQAGRKIYEEQLQRLDDDWGNYWLCKKEELKAEGKKWVDSAKAFIYWDTWNKSDGDPTFDDRIETGSRGVLDLYAKTIQLAVGNTFVAINDSRLDTGTIYITSSLFEWMGYEPTSGYELVYEELKDPWETFLDVFTGVLAVAAITLAVVALTVGTAGVGTAALAVGVMGGAVAFSRGDRVGGLISMIPIVGKIAGAASKVNKALLLFDLGANLVQLGFGGARIYCEIKNSIKEMNELEDKEGLAGIWNMVMCWDNVLVAGFDIGMNLVSIAGDVGDLKALKTSSLSSTNPDITGPDGSTPEIGVKGPEPDTDTTTKQTEVTAGDPVNMVTGALTVSYTDMKLKDITGEFSLVRTYRSVYENKHRMLGSRWLFNIESSLYRTENEISIVLPDTHKERFLKSRESWVNQKQGNQKYRLYETQTGYDLEDTCSGNQYTYDIRGKLQQVTDQNNNTTYYEYKEGFLSRMIFASGQELYFTYSEHKLVLLKDKAGREYRYSYEGELLTSVTYPNDGVVTYEYTKEGYLTGITNENGKKYVTSYYDRKGRVTRQLTADGEEYIYLYDPANRQNIFLATSLNKKVIYCYNSDKLVDKIIYEDGTYEACRYNSCENKIYERNRRGAETFREFRDDGKLIKESLPSGLITECCYDEMGNLIVKKDNQGRQLRYQNDSCKNLISVAMLVKEKQWSEVKFTYDSHGRILREEDARGNVKAWEYDTKYSHANLFVGAEGETVRFTLDEYGRRTMITGERGTVKYGYNHLNFVTMLTDEEGSITSYRYDATGKRVAIITPNQQDQPDPAQTTYHYDLMDHHVKTVDECGNVYASKVDSAGNIIKRIHPNGYDATTEDGPGILYEYDSDGHCIKTIHPDGGIKRIKYDACGNIIKLIQPAEYDPATDDGDGYTYEYDDANRLVQIKNAMGTPWKRYVYDTSGRVVKEMDAKGILSADNDEDRIGTLYTYNIAGWLVEQRTPVSSHTVVDGIEQASNTMRVGKGNTSDTMHEEATQHTHMLVDGIALNSHTAFEKSATTLHTPLDESTQNTHMLVDGTTLSSHTLLDGTASKSVQTSHGGHIMKYRLVCYDYDSCGNQVEVKRYLDYQTENSKRGRVHNITRVFDRSNRLVKVSDSTGACIEYQYNGHNQRISEKLRINDKLSNVKVYTYHPSGRLAGVLVSADRKATGKTMAKTQLTYDKNGNVIVIKTPSGNEIRRDYDAADRLIAETHIEKHGDIHQTTRFEYDAASNLARIINSAGNQVSHQYDWRNRRTLSKGRNGGITFVGYDKNGRVEKVITPNSFQRYAGVGKIDGEVDQKNLGVVLRNSSSWKGYTYHYDVEGRVVEVLAPNDKLEAKYEYNNYGELEQMTDGVGSGVHLTYDFSGRRIQVASKGNATQVYDYDAMGNVTAVVDGVGNRTVYDLDSWGRIREIQKADGSIETYQYDYAGNVIEAVDGEGHKEFYDYNVMNKVASKIDATGKSERYSYDIEGRLCEYTDRNERTIHYEYNLYGNPTKRYHRESGLQEMWGYSFDGRLSYAIGGGMRYDYEYYDNGLLKEKKASGRTLLSYEYDLNGNRTAMSDISGKRTEYRYNDLDLLTEVYDNGTRQALYEYNDDRTIRRLTVGNDIVSEYGYDMDKNITALRTVMGSRTLDRTCSNGAHDGTYIGGAVDGAYSDVSYSRRNVDDAYSRIPYSSGELGMPCSGVSYSGSREFAETRDQNETLFGNQGKIISDSCGGTLSENGVLPENGVQPGSGVLSGSRVLSESQASKELGQNKTLIVTDNQYTFNGNGCCLTKNTIAGLTAYSYDGLNQLVKVAYPTYQEEFSYDRAGNRTRRIHGDIEEQYTYDERNRLTQLAIVGQGKTNNIAYEYDDQGNLIKDEKAIYQYDAFNRMEKAELFNGNIQINHYDGEGLRHEMEENGKLVSFLFAGSRVVAERTNEGTLTRYVRGYEIISADCEKAKTYYHYCSDELGSITHVVAGVGKGLGGKTAVDITTTADTKKTADTKIIVSDTKTTVAGTKTIAETKTTSVDIHLSVEDIQTADSRILNHYEYDAFGNTITCEETVANRFRFTGEQFDSITAQYYLRARFYNPVIGRFLQEDTYYGDGLNLYAYAKNNPVYYTDPSGHEVMSPAERRYQDVGADPETAKLASECYPDKASKADLYNKYKAMGYDATNAKMLADYEIIHGKAKAENFAANNVKKAKGSTSNFTIDADGNVQKIQSGYGNKGGSKTLSIVDTAKKTMTGEDWCRYFREEYGADNVVWENATPSQLARSWQGAGKYPGIDIYEDITISKGKIIYRGEPKGTEYFTTKDAIEDCNRNAIDIFEGLQVRKDPVHGYRGTMQGYMANEDLAAAYGITNANPQFGKGGLPQMFVPDAQELINKGILVPVDNISLLK